MSLLTFHSTLLPLSLAPFIYLTSEMSFPLNVLVTGYGNLGSVLLRTLTSSEFKSKIRTFLLVRPSSLADPSKRVTIDSHVSRGVTLLEGDLEVTPVPQLTATLVSAGIHAVVSVVGFQQLPAQFALIEAAKAAGVSHFIPSEFGGDVNAMDPSGALGQLIQGKLEVQKVVKDSGLAWTIVLSSGFAEFLITTSFFGTDVPNATVNAPASFDTVITTAPLAEIAYVTALALIEPAAKNRTLYVGSPYSFEEITQALEAATGKTFIRKVRTRAEVNAAIAANPHDMVSRFASAFMDGKGTRWPVSETYLAQNHPEYLVTSFKEFAADQLKAK